MKHVLYELNQKLWLIRASSLRSKLRQNKFCVKGNPTPLLYQKTTEHRNLRRILKTQKWSKSIFVDQNGRKSYFWINCAILIEFSRPLSLTHIVLA